MLLLYHSVMKSRAAGFSLLAFICLSYASTGIGVTWDEPIWLYGARKIQNFFVQPEFTKQGITNLMDGFHHGDDRGFPKIAGAFSLILFEKWVGELTAFRMANILLFSMMGGLIYYSIARRFGNEFIALLTALICFCMPRLTGESMLGDTDSTVATMSLPAVLSAYLGARRRSARWAAVSGLFCGICLASKFIGFVVILTILLWTFLYYRRNGIFIYLLVPVITLVIFLILNPYLWPDPIGRSISFVVRSVSFYSTEPHFGYYFGKIFRRTPWSFPFVYLVATNPPVSVIFPVAGLVLVARQRFSDPLAGLFALMILFPMLMVLLPNSVAFGGARFFLTSFIFFGLMSAWALKQWWNSLSKPLLLGGMVVATILPAIVSHPFELEYYAPQIGGLYGASRLGMEITYWWDAANPDFHARANALLPRDAKVSLFPADHPLLDYYAARNYLNGSIVPAKESEYMVVLCYPSCEEKRLTTFVRGFYPNPTFLLEYPDEEIPFVLLLHR